MIKVNFPNNDINRHHTTLAGILRKRLIQNHLRSILPEKHNLKVHNEEILRQVEGHFYKNK